MNGVLESSWAVRQSQWELDVYGKRGITLVNGKGSRLWDDAGNSYVDCIAGHGSANLGHGHPRLLEALTHQANRLISCPGSFFNPAKAECLERLISIAPSGLNRGFLCNSGAEAVEAALKFARMTNGRLEIVAAKGGFHGRTFGAMSATHSAKDPHPCGPVVPGFRFVAFNDVAAMEELVCSDTCAVILEVVQGEGGVHPGSADMFAAVADLCRRHGALLIVDEVQTGFGRTGKMFACDHFDLQPDLLCLAKSIGGGLPMGAVLANQQIKVGVGQHGSTFGGNPLACAASIATINTMIEDELPQQATWKGAYLVRRLGRSKSPMIREIRHLGLMIGIELKCRVRPVLEALARRGVLALPAGRRVLRLLPPLVITEQELDQVAQAVEQSLRSL